MKNTDTTERYYLILFSVLVTAITLGLTGYAAYLSNSVTLFADFLKCLVEFLAILLAFIILTRTRKLDLTVYNFGFGKLEQLSSTVVAFAMFCSGLLCVVTAIDRILEPELIEGAQFGLILAVLSVLGNGFMWLRFSSLHKRTPSPVSQSQSRLFLSKLLASGVVVISLVLSFQSESFPLLLYSDAVGSLALAGFLLVSAHSLAVNAIGDLVDRSLDETLQMAAMKVLVTHEQHYLDFKGIRSRQIGSKRFIQVFLMFEGDQTINEVGHEVKAIRAELMDELPDTEVMIVPVWDENMEWRMF